MTATKAIVHTKSVKKRSVNLTIEACIEEFKSLMKSCKPGKYLLSAGVSSELEPQAVWMLQIYPNGDAKKTKGKISVFLHLTGPMVVRSEGAKKTLFADFHIYLLDGSERKSDVWKKLGSWTSDFGEKYYAWGWRRVSRKRVKKALQADGSLRVAADIEFLLPSHYVDVGVGKVCVASALHGDGTQKQPGVVKSSPELHSDKASSDHDGSEIEKRLIEKLLSAEKIVVMAKQPGSHSLETLRKACIELIACTGRSVYASAAWKELKETKPELATDLAEGVSATVLAAKKP